MSYCDVIPEGTELRIWNCIVKYCVKIFFFFEIFSDIYGAIIIETSCMPRPSDGRREGWVRERGKGGEGYYLLSPIVIRHYPLSPTVIRCHP